MTTRASAIDVSRPEQVNGVRVPYDRSTADLIDLAKKGGPEGWAAYCALGCRLDPAATAALLEATRAKDWTHRNAAAEALGRFQPSDRVLVRILELLEDRSGYVQRTALEVVAKHELLQARGRVWQMLKAAQASTRVAALRALGTIWSPDDFEEIAKVQASDRSSEVRKAAARVLWEHADAHSWPTLYQQWRTDHSGRHRHWAVELAGRFGSARVLADLDNAAEDRDGHVRKAATRPES